MYEKKIVFFWYIFSCYIIQFLAIKEKFTEKKRKRKFDIIRTLFSPQFTLFPIYSNHSFIANQVSNSIHFIQFNFFFDDYDDDDDHHHLYECIDNDDDDDDDDGYVSSSIFFFSS